MADLTITLKTQAVNTFGPAPSQQWGSAAAMSWGSSHWGSKSNVAGQEPSLIEDISKIWTGSNSILPTMPANAVMLDFSKLWSGANSVTVIYQNSDKEEFTGNGYNYVFIDRVINAESGAIQTYSSLSVGSNSWLCGSVGSTVWS